MGPFFSYYGSKHRIIGRYPYPRTDTIIEPFAGSAAYATRHNAKTVLLYDANPRVCGVWEYLIRTPKHELLSLNLNAHHVDEVDGPQEAKWLFGFWFIKAATEPSRQASGWATSEKGQIRPNGTQRSIANAGEAIRRCAEQVDSIRHWRVFNAPYTEAPCINADWFVDPPYSNEAGKRYTFSDLYYPDLAARCRNWPGQVIVCENEGATWLPFVSIGEHKGQQKTSPRDEAIWVNDESMMSEYRLQVVENAI